MTASLPPAVPGVPGGQGAAACAWHPDRRTGLQCTRCGRPACPECLTPASVGFHCRQCVAESRAGQRVARTVAGSRVGEQPLITYLLLAVNLAVFAVTAVQARSVMDQSTSAVFNLGALVPTSVADGEYYRVITSGFLHASLIHVALNMLSLYLLGPHLERMVGRVRFSAIYLLSLLGGSASVMLFENPVSRTVGASGAIFGLLGALVAVFKRHRYDLRQLVVVLALNLFITFQVPSISWQGHLGGLVVGLAVGAAMVYPPARTRTVWQVGVSAGLLVVLVALIVYRTGQIPAGLCEVRADGQLWCVPWG